MFLGASSVSADDLTGTKWLWTGVQTPVGRTTILHPENYRLDFMAGGKVAVQADCNKGSGTYKVEGNNLTFGPIAMTRMMCPEGSMDTKFVQGLGAARHYKVFADLLTIDLVANGGWMGFRREGSNPLIGTKWSWSNSQTPAGMVTPPISSNYTLEFLAGTVNVKADCNTGSGSYKTNGDEITFGPMAMTRMACPPGSMDSMFLKHLGSVKTFSVGEGTMQMNMASDGGTMNYASVGAKPANPLVSTAWNWVSSQTSAGNVSVPTPNNYTLAFLTDTRNAVQADCNKGNGSYTVEGNTIKFGNMAMTMMACPPGSLADTFMRQLGSASTFKIVGDRLTFDIANGGTMTFSIPKPANPLVGTAWNWVSSRTSAGNVSVPTPKNYTLAFLTDTRNAVQADCNKGNGSYTVEGNTIKFGNMAMTMMACPPGSLADTFMRQLGSASTYKIVGDRLTFEIAGGGTMTFARPTS